MSWSHAVSREKILRLQERAIKKNKGSEVSLQLIFNTHPATLNKIVLFSNKLLVVLLATILVNHLK